MGGTGRTTRLPWPPFLMVPLVAARLIEVLRVSPRVFPDTAAYMREVSFIPWRWPVPIGRAPLTGAVFAALGHEGEAIVVFQAVFAAACWTLLIWAVTDALSQPWVRLAAAVALVLLSVVSTFTLWDGILLSESLSLSLGCLSLAAVLWALRDGLTPWRAIAVATVFALFGLVRDTNAQVGFIVALVVAGAVAVRYLSRRWIAVAAVLIGIFALSVAVAIMDHRGKVVAHDEILMRVSTSRSEAAYFHAHGMPLPPALASYGRRLNRGVEDSQLFYAEFGQDPRLAGVRHWSQTHGMATIFRWRLSHPGVSLVMPFRTQGALTADFALYEPTGFRPLLPSWLRPVVHPTRAPILIAEGVIAVALAGVAMHRRRVTTLLVVAVALLLLAVPHAILVWNGEALEVARHGLLLDLQVRAALLLVVAAALDGLLATKGSDDASACAALNRPRS
jgi:hypothetical protein